MLFLLNSSPLPHLRRATLIARFVKFFQDSWRSMSGGASGNCRAIYEILYYLYHGAESA
jgi:hypothetical protein